MLNCGDIAWGYAFALKNTNYHAHIKLLPVQGKLHGWGTREQCEEFMDDCPQYFVPLDDHGNEVWRKARLIKNTNLASSKEEAVEEYNKLVDDTIKDLVHTAERLASQRIEGA